MLIDALKKQAVEERMDLSEAAQRRYFETHQDRFRLKAEIRLVEILSRYTPRGRSPAPAR